MPNVQYSDAIQQVTITASDLETPESALMLSHYHHKVGEPEQVESILPGLSVTDLGVVNGQRVWTISGPALVNAGVYSFTARVTDAGDGLSEPLAGFGPAVVIVERESATVEPSASNPATMAASTPGGTATGTTAPICFNITEIADGSPGNSSLIDSVSLFASEAFIPFITSAQDLVFTGGGIGQPRTACFTITLTNAPIGEYEIGLQVDSGFYASPQSMTTFSIVEPRADLLVGLGVNNLNPKQGDLITYTVTVRNFGPNNALDVVVNDVLPSGSTFHSARANRGRFTAPLSGQTGTVTWYLGDLIDAGQDSAQIDVTVIVKGPTTIVNTASVSSLIVDPNYANNSASLSTSVVSSKGGGGGGKKK